MTGALSGPGGKTVGIKQTLKAIRDGRANTVFLAMDAEAGLLEPLAQACEEQGIPVTRLATMRELGRMFGIQVPAAAAALTKG